MINKRKIFGLTKLSFVLILVLVSILVYYTTGANAFNKTLDKNTRPELVPPPPLPPLVDLPFLKPISSVKPKDQVFVNYFAFAQGGLYGVKDLDGQIVLPATFDSVQVFDGFSLVFGGGKYSLYDRTSVLADNINLTGLKIINPTILQSDIGLHYTNQIIGGMLAPITIDGYKAIFVDAQNYFVVVDENLRYGIANSNGTVVPPYFDSLTDIVDGWSIGQKCAQSFAVYSRLPEHIYLLPSFEGFQAIYTAQNIFFYQSYDRKSVVLFDVLENQIKGKELRLDNIGSVVYPRVFGKYIILVQDDKMALYDIYTKSATSFDGISFFQRGMRIYFVVESQQKYELLDINMNVLVQDMDCIQYDFNLLLQKDGVAQVFAFQ